MLTKEKNNMKQSEAVVMFWKQGVEQGLTGEALKAYAVEEVYHGLMAGDIDYRDQEYIQQPKNAMSYAKSVVHNYHKKNPEMNGGVKYEPATKRGPLVKDPTYKSLKGNLKVLESQGGDLALIAATKARMTEIEALEKASKPATKNTKTLQEALAELAELGVQV